MHDYDASHKLWILDDGRAQFRSGANAVALLSASLSDTLHSFAYVAVMNGGRAGDRKTSPPPPASRHFTSSGGRRTRPYNQEHGAPIKGQEKLCLVQKGVKVHAGLHYCGKWRKMAGKQLVGIKILKMDSPELLRINGRHYYKLDK